MSFRHHRGPSSHYRTWRRTVFRRDGYACVKCGSRHRLEVDHIVPLAKGGTGFLENLQTLCRDCHMEKTASERPNPVPGQAEWGKFAAASRFAKGRH